MAELLHGGELGLYSSGCVEPCGELARNDAQQPFLGCGAGVARGSGNVFHHARAFTPGLHATNPWLPAAAATVLGIVANLIVTRMESRKG
ncbi:hypothetical protein ABZV77_13585 [Streptomyces sp. NPDC004732]|uniref:hypothetical protein n=1 Tax=Streptomyces sp. NPDC004732 TaxID=3154290 RepID=UPI0033A884AE